MQQAVLILIHKNLGQVIRLIRYFEGTCDIFIHVDRRSGFTSKEIEVLKAQPGVKGVYRKYKLHWGGFSILQAEMLLLKEALRHSGCRYVHLISGQDYPLKPLSHFLSFFETANEEFLRRTHLLSPNWDDNTYKRLQYFYPMDWFSHGTPDEIQQMGNFAHLQEKWGNQTTYSNVIQTPVWRFTMVFHNSSMLRCSRQTLEKTSFILPKNAFYLRS